MLDVLTPPNSQTDSQVEETCSALALHQPASSSHFRVDNDLTLDFLRAFFYLEHQLKMSPALAGQHRIETNDVLAKSVLAVLRFIDTDLRRAGRADFSQCLDGLHVCVQLLDRQTCWNPAVSERLALLLPAWLDSMAGDGLIRSFSLLHILAGSSGMAGRLADELLKRISDSLRTFNSWEWDGAVTMPQSLLSHFAQTAYHLLLLERTIDRLAVSDKKRFVSSLPPLEARVYLHFPLLAASVMRLTHLLAF